MLDMQQGSLHLYWQADEEGVSANLQRQTAKDANCVHISRTAAGGSQNARKLYKNTKINR
jgi:hypothetical protein